MKKKVYAYLHTHWDIEWYRDKEDFTLRLLEVFDVVLDELKKNNAPFFYFDGQTAALLDYLKYRPEKLQEVLYFIKNNKLAIGPFYISADSYLINFCSMLKNLDLGLKTSKEFNQKEFIGYMSDIFGVSNSIFEALKLKNIDKALIWRGVNPKKIKNNCNFIKNSIKTTWLIQGYFNDFFHQKNSLENIKKYLDKIAKYSDNTLLLPIGADHFGILKDANKKIKEINSKLKDYEIILSNPFEYFSQAKYSNTTNQTEFLDNSNTYILQGVYSARIYQKIKNHKIQNTLSRIVEPLDFYFESKYENYIEEIYKTLLLNHAHDGIYGCSIDEVHKTIDARQEKCLLMINALLKRLIGDFKTKHNLISPSTNKIGIFNLSNNDNIKTVKFNSPYLLKNTQLIETKECFCDELLYDIYKIPVTEDITKIYTQIAEISPNKKFEYTTVKIKKPIKKTKLTATSIENDYIKLEIKDEKIYIVDKKTLKNYSLNLSDTEDAGDSYNYSPKGQRKLIKLNESKILNDNIIESTLLLNFKDIKIYAILNNFAKFIKFKIEINNKTKNHKLQLVLNLNNNIKQTINDDAVGIIKRKIDYNYNMQDFMPVLRPFELKTNTYPMQNFVCANNAIVLTKGLNEYEIYQNELRICLLRAFSTISNPKNKTRAIPAGPDLKTPEGQCIRNITEEIALSFGNYKEAYKYLDEFEENYTIIYGQNDKDLNFKLDEVKKDEFIYGINEGKKIIYNLRNKNISLI